MAMLLAIRTAAFAAETVWLDELDVGLSQCGWGSTQRNKSVAGKPLLPVTAEESAATTYPAAMRRPPSQIKPDVEGSKPFSYPRLVQPVLHKHCVNCHAKEDKAADLSGGDVANNKGAWYPSYNNLRGHAYFIHNQVFTTPMTIPGQFAARASKLYALLRKDHYKVKMSKEDMHRITLWLDCNSDFFGSYEDTEQQAKGEVVQPTLE